MLSDVYAFLTRAVENTDRVLTVAEKAMDEVETLQRDVSDLKRERRERHDDALRRQIAINLEYEVKVSCLEKVDDLKKQPYRLSDGQWDEQMLLNTAMDRVFDLLDNPGREALIKEWFENKEQNYHIFLIAMRRLKGAFSESVHPTETFEGRPVDADFAKRLLDEKLPPPRTERGRAKTEWSDDQLKEEAKKCVEKLVLVRKKNGERDLLIA